MNVARQISRKGEKAMTLSDKAVGRLYCLFSVALLSLFAIGCLSAEVGDEARIVQALEDMGVEACPRGYHVIEGTEGDDVIQGTRWRDCIVAYGGNDVINSLQGSDIVIAGAGDDVIDTGNGRDQVFGGEGDDIINLGNGRDGDVHGGPGNDVIDAGNGSDSRIYGDEGDDIIRVGNGRDRAYGGEGNDLIEGGRGSDRLWGGPGHDVIIGGCGWDRERGEEGYDACKSRECEVRKADGCEVDADCADGYWCILPGGLCVPPDGRDANGVNICNGVDDDFDGAVDEDYFPESTTCEVGGCLAVGAMQCVDGVETDTCLTDPVCIAETACDDAADNDGDGDADCDDDDCAEAPNCQIPEGDYGDACEADADCGAVGDGAYCATESEWGYVDGYCTKQCSGGLCCPAGTVLYNSTCVLTCNADRTCDNDRLTCHQMSGMTTRACFALCYDDSDCESGDCVFFPRKSYGLCG
jgi:hypothetical protein